MAIRFISDRIRSRWTRVQISMHAAYDDACGITAKFDQKHMLQNTFVAWSYFDLEQLQHHVLYE